MTHLIAIDQGTTSTRAIVFDAALAPVASASEELAQIYPAPGEVEHDGEAIWAAVVKTVRAAMRSALCHGQGRRRHEQFIPQR